MWNPRWAVAALMGLTLAGSVVGQKLPSDDSTFMVAVVQGDVPLAKKMLDDKRADANGANGAGFTWLYLAADHGHFDMVELLLARGAAVHADLAGKNAAVYIASKRGRLEIVKLLLDKDGNVDGVGVDGQTPLQVASGPELIKLLVQHGANVNVQDQRSDSTPLHQLVSTMVADKSTDPQRRREAIELVKLLLAHKADVHARNDAGASPLHLALRGDLELTRLLLEAGASPHERLFEPNPSILLKPPRSAGNTPLHWAAETGRLDLAKLLLEFGADVNAKNQTSQTPLLLAARANQREMAEFLLMRGAVINMRDTSGRTPLSEAGLSGHKELMQLLEQHGGRK